jgi:MSHA biogenesis protein MshO
MTLIELIVAMVVMGIIIGATVYFAYPVIQSVDVAGRAQLTDIADNALQRIGREARLALPNSIRTATFGNQEFVEFLPIRTAGRYRADAGGGTTGTDCTDIGSVGQPASDQLSFDAIVDTCFKTIGTLPLVDFTSITTDDFLVFNNYGPGFSGQNAYATTGTLNRRKISTKTNDGTRVRFDFTSGTALDRTLHDSPGRRFFVAIGNATTVLPEAVTYECNKATGVLTRRWGYTMVETPTSPPTFAGASATSATIATNVTDCHFDYAQNVAPQIGLLTLRLTLSRPGSVGTVSLYHAVHVTNIP